MHSFEILSVLNIVFIGVITARTDLDDYKLNRTLFLEEEFTKSLGGTLRLTEDEKLTNETLMRLKQLETDYWFRNPGKFNFSKHYFSYRDQIEKSEVYQIIRKMPKGGALHIHQSFMLGADYMLSLTYEDHLYACYNVMADDLILLFSENIPQQPCSGEWSLLSDIRNAAEDIHEYDMNLKKYFTLHQEDGDMHSDINSVWQKFEKVYHSTKGLITYRPLTEKYFSDALKRFYDDNVVYIEIRTGLHKLYELNGTEHDKMYMATLFQDITNKFIVQYPDFVGVKLILSDNRLADVETVSEAINMARILKKEMPNLFAGFDLVGQEDLGKPLYEFLPILFEAKQEMNLYFHGGETNWFGTTTDENLIDAVLLGSKRIGHAYALIKHPSLIRTIFHQDIALEINVISNAVLALVKDVRNHPLATYLALGLPVVLSSDDPGVWGAAPLSHDFYVAFVAVASNHSDLRMLKQLALNSIKYSSLDRKHKKRFYKVFYRRWNTFIRELNAEYRNQYFI